MIYAAATALVVTAAVALTVGLFSSNGPGPLVAAAVASVGALLLLGVGVLRSSEPPSAR